MLGYFVTGRLSCIFFGKKQNNLPHYTFILIKIFDGFKVDLITIQLSKILLKLPNIVSAWSAFETWVQGRWKNRRDQSQAVFQSNVIIPWQTKYR